MSHTSLEPTFLRDRLLSVLAKRTYPKTACPSEIPRSLTKCELQDLGATEWRDLMPTMRELAFKLRDDGEVEILQKGEVVKWDTGIDEVKGPIRVRLLR